jgi:hypothetical protein
MGGTRHGRRVTMAEAAEILGVSTEAIRKRVQRGSIRTDKGPDGRRYVYLDESHPESQGEGSSSPLVEELRGRIEDLRDQLAAERRANEENRRIIAALTQRIPEIEAPRATESTREPSEPPAEGSTTPGQGEAAERLSWWRRIFLGE